MKKETDTKKRTKKIRFSNSAENSRRIGRFTRAISFCTYTRLASFYTLDRLSMY